MSYKTTHMEISTPKNYIYVKKMSIQSFVLQNHIKRGITLLIAERRSTDGQKEIKSFITIYGEMTLQ